MADGSAALARAVVYVMDPRFGASGDIADGNDTNAFFNAIDYASELLDNTTNGYNSALVYSPCDHAISDQLVLPPLNRLHFLTPGTIRVRDWVRPPTDPMFVIQARQSKISWGKFDCGGVAAGVLQQGSGNELSKGRVGRFRTYGLHADAGGGSSYEFLKINQWTQDDDEFAHGDEWDADGLLVTCPDSTFFKIDSGWSRYPLRLAAGASLNFFEVCHWFNGRPNWAANGYDEPVDPIIVRNEVSSTNFLIENYLDNGHVVWRKPGLVVRGGQVLVVPANVTMTGYNADPALNAIKHFQFYRDMTDGVPDGDQPLLSRIRGIKAGVEFLAGDSGLPYAGDYSVMNAVVNSDNLGTELMVMRRVAWMIPDDSDVAAPIEIYKAGGNIQADLRTGSSHVRLFATGTDFKIASTTMSFADGTNTVRWKFTSAGSLVHDLTPLADGVSNIGAAATKVLTTYTRYLGLEPALAVPGPVADVVQVVATAGNALKAVFPDGTVKTFTLV